MISCRRRFSVLVEVMQQLCRLRRSRDSRSSSMYITPCAPIRYSECRSKMISDPRVPSSKLNPHEFIGRFKRMAIACLQGEANKRSGPGRPKRTPDPHLAAFGIERAAPSNRRAGAQPNSSSVLSPLGSAVLDPVLALVAAMARQPDHSPARDSLALAP